MPPDIDIDKIASDEGVPSGYLRAILGQENSGDTSISSAGAVGRGQLIPATFKSVLPEGDINNPADNVRAAAKYLKQGLDKSGGSFQDAAMYYYGGPAYKDKMAKAPNKKYGTNPDGTAGISLEDYGRAAAAKAETYGQNTGNSMSVEDFINSSFPADGSTSNDPAVKLASLSRVADEQIGRIQDSGATLSDKLKANIKRQMDVARNSGELAAQVKLDEFQQQSTKAGENADLLSKLGINTSDINSLIAGISTDMTETFKAAMGLREDINQKKSVGFFDNPAEWLMNQLHLPDEIRAHNALIDKNAASKKFVEQATGVASAVANVNTTKFTTVSLKGAQASADIARNDAEQKSLALEDKLLTTDYDKQVKTLTAIQARMANINNSLTADVIRQSRTDAETQKKMKLEAQQLDDYQVNVAGKTLGMEIADRKTLDKQPKDVKDAVNYILANGGNIGKDPLEAWQVLARGNYKMMPPAVAYQRNILDTAKRTAEDVVMKDPLIKTSNPKQVKEAISNEMERVLQHASTDPNYSMRQTPTGVVENPYHVPAPDIMEKLPDARSLPFTKVIADHKKNFPNQLLTDQMALELAYANVGEGKAYPDIITAARDISAYYRAGVDYNNHVMKFSNFGMVDQGDYKVNGVDLANPASVIKYFVEKERRSYGMRQLGELYAP